MSSHTYLYGKNPLKEALLAQRREARQIIDVLYITKRELDNPDTMSLLQTYNQPYTLSTIHEIESMVGKDTVHQGICATLIPDTLYTSLEKILGKKSASPRLLVVLDELEDPHNVGAIIRSAVSFGASAILMPTHGQVALTGSVIKSASGMNFSIPIIKIGNVNTTLEKLKKDSFWIYGLTGTGETNLHTTKFDTDTVIVIGNEGRGLQKMTEELCDFRLSIPISKRAESLNASNAVAITLYEWYKQNKY